LRATAGWPAGGLWMVRVSAGSAPASVPPEFQAPWSADLEAGTFFDSLAYGHKSACVL
jgi:hypothetical protein